MISMGGKFSLGKKLILGFAIIICTVLVTNTSFYFQIDRLQYLSDAIAKIWLPGVVKSSELIKIIASLRVSQLEYLLASDNNKRSEAEDSINSYAGSFQIYLKTLDESLTTDEDHHMIQTVQMNWDELYANNEKLLELVKAGKISEAESLLMQDMQKNFIGVQEGLQEIADTQYKGGIQATDMSTASFQKSKMISIASAVISIIFSLLVSIGIYLLITRSLTKIIESLKQSASESYMTSKDLSLTSDALSRTSDTAMSSVTETLAAIEEINSMIAKTVANAQQSQTKSQSSQESVHQGRDVVERLNSTMNELDSGITGMDQEIANIVRSLNDIVASIQTVNSKVEVINEIVFQTRLLSFNASVESARAGEHGKGFAVVAEEVRNLAQMSGNASEEINTIVKAANDQITQIVNETKSRFEVLTDQNKARISQSHTVVRELGDVFGQIIKGVEDIITVSSDIARASEEQSLGITEISTAMGHIDKATQTNQKSSKLVSTSSEKMYSQVQSLLTSVSSLEALLQGQGMTTHNLEERLDKVSENTKSQTNNQQPTHSDDSVTG